MSTPPAEPSSRRALHAYVSDAAHSQWHDFAAENGVSVSALLEVLSQHLLRTPDADGAHPTPSVAGSGKVENELVRMIADARQLDAARRRRNKST